MQPYESFKHGTVLLLVTPRVPAGANSTQVVNELSIYYKPSLFNAHTMILIVHIFMNVNKLCLNQ